MKSFSYLYLGYVVPASTLIPIIAGIIFYKQINKPLRTLLVYLSASLVINIAGIVLSNYHVNNLPLLHFYTIVELVTVMLYYLKAFGPSKTNKWIKGIMLLFPLLCIINFSFFQSIYKFNTYTRPLEALIIILVTGVYLATQSNFKNRQLITRSGATVAAAFMIYFCSSLFQFIFSNVVSQKASPNVKLFIWDLHATFVLIMYLMFFKAIIDERSKG